MIAFNSHVYPVCYLCVMDVCCIKCEVNVVCRLGYKDDHEFNKILSGHQLCQTVERNQCFWNCLCPHQGTKIVPETLAYFDHRPGSDPWWWVQRWFPKHWFIL